MKTNEKICCVTMKQALRNRNMIPINLDNGELPCGLEYLDMDPDEKYFISDKEYRETFPYDHIIYFCPFCGKCISVFNDKQPTTLRNSMCSGFLSWFDDKERPTTSQMFEYDHRNNQFYMHKRKDFGDGLIPINYCIYCGEPLSEMINKYGVPKEIQNSTHPDEWWKKRGL